MKKTILVVAPLVLLSSSAFAADLATRKAPGVSVPAPMWTGLYAGLSAGYGFGTNSNINAGSYGNFPLALYPGSNVSYGTPFGSSFSGSFGSSQSGYVAGAQIGYNYQYNKFVVGLEADISGSGIRGGGSLNQFVASNSPVDTVGLSVQGSVYGNSVVNAGVDYLGTVRGRFGYLVTPSLLAFATGGLSYGGVYANSWETSSAQNQAGITYSQQVSGYGRANALLTGWNVGGGLEWMFLPNWSLKAEGIYWDLGNANVQTNAFGAPNGVSFYIPGTFFSYSAASFGNSQINYQGVIARAGLNYHFSGYEAVSNQLLPILTRGKQNISSTPVAWGGLYAGLSAGFGFGTNGSTVISSYGAAPYPMIRDSVTDLASNGQYASPFGQTLSGIVGGNQNGAVGGAQVGYNYMYGSNIVLGIETDISGSAIRGGATKTGVANSFGGPDNFGTPNSGRTYAGSATGFSTINAGVDYIGTVRGRVGYLITPTLLTYGTGGFSYGGVYSNVSQSATNEIIITRIATGASVTSFENVSGYGSSNQLLTGWNAGGGLEWMFLPNWSLKAEGIYWNLGNANVNSIAIGPANSSNGSLSRGSFIEVPPYAVTRTQVNYQGVIARAGVNYHFNMGNIPVVAKF